MYKVIGMVTVKNEGEVWENAQLVAFGELLAYDTHEDFVKAIENGFVEIEQTEELVKVTFLADEI
jgi:hypothetical protein